MRQITLIIASILIAAGSFAQDIKKIAKAKAEVLEALPPDTAKAWKVQGNASLQFSQAAFSNWSSGGQNALGLVAWINLMVNYHHGRNVWANTIDLGYGFNLLGKGDEAKYTKTNDKFEVTTAYGYELDQNKKWYLSVLANFRTQFSNGYNYPNDSTVVSRFMSPGYLVTGIGITYTPAKWFYLYISPSSGRLTFVTDKALSDSGSFGVPRGKHMLAEFGSYLRADLNKNLSKNINLSTTLELFSNYFHEYGNIDVNWGLLLSMKVNKWLAASIQTQLIYDNNVLVRNSPTDPGGPRTQFKELLGVGLTYKFR